MALDLRDKFRAVPVFRPLRKLGRAEEAMGVVEPIQRELERKGTPDGWIDEETAECLLAAGKAAEARLLFARAYQALKDDSWVVKHEPKKLERLKRLGMR